MEFSRETKFIPDEMCIRKIEELMYCLNLDFKNIEKRKSIISNLKGMKFFIKNILFEINLILGEEEQSLKEFVKDNNYVVIKNDEIEISDS